MIIATKVPIFPILSATASNLIYNGVAVFSERPNFFISPYTVFSPTKYRLINKPLRTSINPEPSITLVPDIKKGVFYFGSSSFTSLIGTL